MVKGQAQLMFRYAAIWAAIPLSVRMLGTLWTNAKTRGEWALGPMVTAGAVGLIVYMAVNMLQTMSCADDRTVLLVNMSLLVAGIALWLPAETRAVVDDWWNLSTPLFGAEWRAGLFIAAIIMACLSLIPSREPTDKEQYSRKVVA